LTIKKYIILLLLLSLLLYRIIKNHEIATLIDKFTNLLKLEYMYVEINI